MTGWPTEEGRFALGDFAARAGGTIKAAQITWKSYGKLSPSGDNVVLYPTSYGGQHPDLEWLIAPDGILDPTRWFIVIPNLLGNGLSSSPSNTPDYPSLVTPYDNVVAQRRFLEQRFGISELACVYGWSMGGQQAYHWAAAFPEAVRRIVVVCGSARTAVHNRVFLAGLMATLEAAPEHLGNGRFSAQPHAALRAFARVYAGWGLSQDFYRAGLHLSGGRAGDLESFLATHWEQRFARRHAADLYAQLRCWDAADIAAVTPYDGDLARALAAIRARVLLMPSDTDLYFRVADNVAEQRHLKSSSLRIIPSIWGHRAGNPTESSKDVAFIRQAVRDWLDDDG